MQIRVERVERTGFETLLVELEGSEQIGLDIVGIVGIALGLHWMKMFALVPMSMSVGIALEVVVGIALEVVGLGWFESQARKLFEEFVELQKLQLVKLRKTPEKKWRISGLLEIFLLSHKNVCSFFNKIFRAKVMPKKYLGNKIF